MLSEKIKSEIPRRMHKKVIFANYFAVNKSTRNVLVLTSKPQLFEVKKCEIIFGIDLSESILKEATQLPTQSDRHPDVQESGKDQSRKTRPEKSINIGRYVFYEGQKHRIFILLKVFENLVVIERCANGFKLVIEYKNVEKFEILDPGNSFTPRVFIHLKSGTNESNSDGNSNCIETNFVNDDIHERIDCNENDEGFPAINRNTVIDDLIKEINNDRTELAIQEAKTAEEFIRLKNILMFGPNSMRGIIMEEKQPLGRYGDVWIKYLEPELIFGIPIVNNCNHRLLTLFNIRVLLSVLSENGAAVESEDHDHGNLAGGKRESDNGVEFEYKLFQLLSDSYEFENLDELLNSSDEECNINGDGDDKSKRESISDDYGIHYYDEWIPVKEKILQPNCSAVVLIKMRMNDEFVLHRQQNFTAYVLYDVKANGQEATYQISIPNIIVEPDAIFKEEKYQLQFDLKSLHKDLLTFTFASSCSSENLRIEFSSDNLPSELDNFLKERLKFTKVDLRGKSQHDENKMETDMSNEDILNFKFSIDKYTERMYFHKDKTYTYWYGTLIRTFHHVSTNVIFMKLYIRNEQKVFVLVNEIYKYLPEGCKIQFNKTKDGNVKKLRHLEDSLRRELKIIEDFHKENGNKRSLKRSEIYEFQKELFIRELETDLSMMDVS